MKLLHYHQRGMSLVELMVALTVGLFLTAGVLTIFQSSRQTYSVSDAVSDLQESGRFAIEMLTRDIRLAGYQGCADLNGIKANIVANGLVTTNFYETVAQGAEKDADGNWLPGPNPPTDIAAEAGLVIPNTDVLMIQRATAQDLGLKNPMATRTDPLVIDANSSSFRPATEELLMIADCQSVDIFRASNVAYSEMNATYTVQHANTHNTSAELSKPYGTDAQVMRFQSFIYYVADTGRTSQAGDPVHALFRQVNAATPVEMIAGVENMQVLYGELDAANNMRYVAASDATLDMTLVKSVKVGLLVHTLEPVNDHNDAQNYTVAGNLFEPLGTPNAAFMHAADRRMRRVFNATVRIRNRR